MIANQEISKLVIEGGASLNGTVTASGSKNSALPLLAASILVEGHSVLHNVPYLMDVITMLKMLKALGVRAEFHKPNTVKIWNEKTIRPMAPYDLVTAMRASFFVAGPILARTGFAKVPLPGGCAIGSRPVNIHLKGFEALGVSIQIQHGFVEMKSPKLKGAKVYMDFPSVGATENVMMAASLAEGETIIENAAREPEISDLARFLNQAGAKVEGAGTSEIRIEGQKKLTGIEYGVIPDRIEVGTLMIAAAMTNGNITVRKVELTHLEPLIMKLKESGIEVITGSDTVQVIGSGKFKAVDLETMPFPGFPTDMQAQMMALACLAEGTSIISETIFENRFMHANELMRMGAKIKLEKTHAVVIGVPELTGAEIKITDLRAGAALVLAGLAAKGASTVYGLKHLKRGYENLPEKIRSLGGNIQECA